MARKTKKKPFQVFLRVRVLIQGISGLHRCWQTYTVAGRLTQLLAGLGHKAEGVGHKEVCYIEKLPGNLAKSQSSLQLPVLAGS